jgi:hypothetical protein
MRSNRSRILALATLLCLVLLTLTVVVWSRGQAAGPASFQSNGSSIVGWYWLRSEGHTATWTFNVHPLQGVKKNSMYLNFAPLVTNGVDGGSGYSTNCVVTVEGKTTKKMTITLDNPYRPIDPENSGGVGYQCYGHSSSCIPASVWKGATTLKVTVSFPFPKGYHVAVKSDAMTLGFSM